MYVTAKSIDDQITGVAPFELVLSRTPDHISLENTPSLSEKPRKNRLQSRQQKLIEKSSKKIQTAQLVLSVSSYDLEGRYKAVFNRSIRPPTEDIEVKHYVYSASRDFSR